MESWRPRRDKVDREEKVESGEEIRETIVHVQRVAGIDYRARDPSIEHSFELIVSQFCTSNRFLPGQFQFYL